MNDYSNFEDEPDRDFLITYLDFRREINQELATILPPSSYKIYDYNNLSAIAFNKTYSDRAFNRYNALLEKGKHILYVYINNEATIEAMYDLEKIADDFGATMFTKKVVLKTSRGEEIEFEEYKFILTKNS